MKKRVTNLMKQNNGILLYRLSCALTAMVTLLPICLTNGDMLLTYRVRLLVIQIGTLLASMLLFERTFSYAETKLPAFIGTLLYMTCPYRIYVCHDPADLSQATALMLLPLYSWAILEIMTGTGKIRHLAVASLALAGVGYANSVFFLAAAGLTLLAGLSLRKLWCLLPPTAAGLLFLPGLRRLAIYLFTDQYRELNLPLGSIMRDGYRLGEYLHFYMFRHDNPGMGPGMLICLLAGIWLGFVGKQQKPRDAHAYKTCVAFTAMAIFFTILSSYYFPWDVFQRIGEWSLKLISLMGTPKIFWGMANLCLCFPAAYAMERIRGRVETPIFRIITLLVLFFSIGVCIIHSL